MKCLAIVLMTLMALPALSQETYTIFKLEKNRRGVVKDSCRAGTIMLNEAGQIMRVKYNAPCADTTTSEQFTYKNSVLVKTIEGTGKRAKTYTIVSREGRPWRCMNVRNNKDLKVFSYNEDQKLKGILYADSTFHYSRTDVSHPKEGWEQRIHIDRDGKPVLIENTITGENHMEFTKARVGQKPFASYRVWFIKD